MSIFKRKMFDENVIYNSVHSLHHIATSIHVLRSSSYSLCEKENEVTKICADQVDAWPNSNKKRH